MTERNKIFNGMGIAASIYIVLFIVTMYSGATVISNYVMPLVCCLVILLFLMAKVKGVQRIAFVNRENQIEKIALILIVLFLLYQLSFSYDKDTTFVFLERFLVYFFLFVFVPKLDICVRIIKGIRWYSFPVAASIILTTLINGDRSGGLVGTYQFAGMMMSISFGVILIDYYYERSMLNLIGLGITFLALLMSGKRTFSLLAVIAYFLIFSFNNDTKKRKKFIRLTFILILLLIVAYFTVPAVRMLAERILLYSGDKTYNGRSYYWTAALSIFSNNKIHGIGMGCFSQYFDVYFHRLGNLEAYDAHNIYIQMLAELGIVGEALFVIFFVICLISTIKLFKKLRKIREKEYGYVLCYSVFLQIWFIVYGATGNPLYGAGQSFFYITSIAMMMSVKHELKIKEYNCEFMSV